MLRFILIAAFGFLLPVYPASAAIDADGAAHLKEIFTKYIADRKTATQAAHQDLRTEGPLTVEPAKNYYAVTLPHLSVYRPDGGYTDIGIVAINASPADKPGEWKMSVAIPSPVTSSDASKKPVLRIKLGTQNFSGVWNEDFENFTRIDAQYQNIAIDNLRDGLTVTVPKSAIAYTLTPDAGGKTWSGPVHYETNGLAVTPPLYGLNDAIPTTISLDAIVQKLPQKTADLWSAFMLRKLLGDAGATAKINKFFFGNAIYTVTMTGQLNANAQIAAGVDGTMHVEIFGLEKLVTLAQTHLQDPNLTPAAKNALQKTLATLMVLQMTGQQGTNAQGQPIRLYDIVLTPQGKTMLNGADLSMLQMMIGAGKKFTTP